VRGEGEHRGQRLARTGATTLPAGLALALPALPLRTGLDLATGLALARIDWDLIPPLASARTGPASPRASPPPPALARSDHDRLRGSAPSVDGGRLVAGRHGRDREERRKFEGRKKKITGILWSFRVQIHVGT
jgi:hypothetical protein